MPSLLSDNPKDLQIGDTDPSFPGWMVGLVSGENAWKSPAAESNSNAIHEIAASDFPNPLTHAETLIEADAKAWIADQSAGVVTRGDTIVFTTALGIQHDYEIVVNAANELTIIQPDYGQGIEYPFTVSETDLVTAMAGGHFFPGSRVDHATLTAGVVMAYLVLPSGGFSVLNYHGASSGGGGGGTGTEVDTLGTVTGRGNVAVGDIEIPQGGRLIMTDDSGERLAVTIDADDGIETNPA